MSTATLNATERYLLGVIHINALDNFLHAGFGAVISAAGYLSYKTEKLRTRARA